MVIISNIYYSITFFLEYPTPTPPPNQVRDTSVRNVSSSTCTAVVWSRYVGSLLQYCNSVLSRVTIAPRFNRYVVDKFVQNSTTMTTTTTTSRDDTKPIRDLLSEVQRFSLKGLVVEDGNQEEILKKLFRCYRVCSEFRESLRRLGVMVGSERVGDAGENVSTQVVQRLLEAKKRLDSRCWFSHFQLCFVSSHFQHVLCLNYSIQKTQVHTNVSKTSRHETTRR